MDRAILTRLEHGRDLVQELERLAESHGLTRGTVQVIGALKGAMLGFFDAEKGQFVTNAVPCPVEMVSGLGNVSLNKGRPKVHLHLIVATREGRCLGGHAMPGCVVFAAEAAFQVFPGPPLERSLDEETGMSLWPRDPE